MIIKAPAKINLCLKVNGLRNDGFHDLTMFMQTISLFDRLEFIVTKSKNKLVNLKSNFPYVPTDDKNLVVKVIKYFFDEYNISGNIDVNLVKMIPTGGGLGGGSSDAASTILFLNDYYKLNLNSKTLIDISAKFGSDIPFFIYKNLCKCEGRGEILTRFNKFTNYYLLIATPNIRISTKEIFEKYDLEQIESFNDYETKINNIETAIRNRDLSLLSDNIFNNLEVVTEKMSPYIAIFKEKIKKMGALQSMMSGSGPTVFGIFKSYKQAKICKESLKKEYSEAFIYIAKPI